MRKVAIGLLCAGVIGAATSATTLATGGQLFSWKPRPHRFFWPERNFQRIATFANYTNNSDIGDTTVSEIVAANQRGTLLAYTDSPMEEIGFIDIMNPAHPLPAGKLAVGGEPTSVDIWRDRWALVAVNTSPSYTVTSGNLVVVDLATKAIVHTMPLGGQPDSIKISPDGRYVAIAIENERDEEVDVDGVEGGLPQAPAGFLGVVRIVNPAAPASWTYASVSLNGLAAYAPNDPEPEFVDVNARNHAVVTMQENNHIAVVDLETLLVIDDFPAGAVTLNGVDNTEDGLISLTDSIANVAREPDAVAWLPGWLGHSRIGTANEGDLFGGSRGFSIFTQDGAVVYDSGSSFEALAVEHGHYPEDRSENKGSEPEAIHYARFGFANYLFVGSERGSFVAVYELDFLGRPRFSQLLPAPLGPEGITSVPSRGLLIVSGEEDDPSFGVRSTVMIYQLRRGAPSYPQIVSDESGGAPIGWSALSGMTSIPGNLHAVLGVWDSYYSESRIFRIDVTDQPAVITDVLTINDAGVGSGDYDPEGIAVAPDGTLWIASEGNATDSRPNRLLQVNRTTGDVMQEIGLPAEILACRAATSKTGTLGSGFEGVAVVPGAAGAYSLVVAQQRGWDYDPGPSGGLDDCDDLDDESGPSTLNSRGEPLHTRLWFYDPDANEWTWDHWELAPLPANTTWVGLSEISRTPNGDYLVIERDNRTGDFGLLKTLVRIALSATDDGLVTTAEKSVFDLRPRLTATHGWMSDKAEGVAVLQNGRTFLSTDNDGVENWSGETWFLDLGHAFWLFR